MKSISINFIRIENVFGGNITFGKYFDFMSPLQFTSKEGVLRLQHHSHTTKRVAKIHVAFEFDSVLSS